MKTSVLLAASVASLLITSIASATVTKLSATINGSQMVPPVTSPGTGTGTFEYDDATSMLSGTVTFTGITATKGEIEGSSPCGAAPAKGVAQFPDPSGNTFTLPPTTIGTLDHGLLIGGGTEVIIRTAANPAGEIRGQIYIVDSGKTCGDPNPPADDAGATGTTDAGGPTTVPTPPKDGGGSVTSDSGADPSNLPGDDGCSTSGSSGGASGMAAALGLALAVAVARRARRVSRGG